MAGGHRGLVLLAVAIQCKSITGLIFAVWLAYTPYYRQNILLFHTFVWFPQKLWSHHKSINLLLTKWTVDLYNNGTGSKLTKEKNPQQV